MEARSASSDKDYILDPSQTATANYGAMRLVPTHPSLSSQNRLNKDISKETPDQTKRKPLKNDEKTIEVLTSHATPKRLANESQHIESKPSFGLPETVPLATQRSAAQEGNSNTIAD